MNGTDEVQARRLTAVLEEIHDGGCPPDLAARVLARVRAVPPRRVRGSWLAAACMLLGIAVVVVTARWRNLGGAVTADPTPASAQDPAHQEPATVRVTTAMVQEACGSLEAPPPGDGVDRLLALAALGKRPLVVAGGVSLEMVGGVRGDSKVDLSGRSWHEMVVHLADELGAGISEFGGVLVVGPGPRVAATKLRCSVPRSTLDVRALAKRLHAQCGLNLVLADDVVGRIELDVVDVPARALLEVVAARLSLQVVGCGGVLVLRRAVVEARPSRVVFNLRRRWVGDAFGLWSRLAGGNFVIAPDLGGAVSVSSTAGSATEPDLLAALAGAVEAEVIPEERGILRIVHRLPPLAAVTLTGEQLTAAAIATMVAVPAGLVAIPDDADGHVAVFVAQAPALDVLRAAAVATGRRWLRTDKGYAVQ